QFRRRRWLADKAFGVGVVGGGQDLGASGPDGCGPAVVDVGGSVQAEAAVMVLVVVPGEEFLAVRPGGFDRGEPGREPRPVLQRLELRFGVRVVAGHVGREWDWVTPRSASS